MPVAPFTNRSIACVVSPDSNGRIRRVGASAQHVRVATVPGADASSEAGQVFASNVDVELSGVRIDKGALLQRKELQVLSIDHMDLTADISQNEASKMLAPVPGVRFEFLQDVVRITLGRIIVGGSFQVEGATRLRFVPAAQGELVQPLHQLRPVLPVAGQREMLADLAVSLREFFVAEAGAAVQPCIEGIPSTGEAILEGGLLHASPSDCRSPAR